MKTRTFADRQSEKTLKGLLSAYLSKNYRLPPKAVETLCNDAFLFQSLFDKKSRGEGQIIYYATKIGEPPSKSLKDAQKISVKLTVTASRDIEVRKKQGVHGLNIEIMKRIAKESHGQGALLTLEDISNILHIGIRTTARYKKIIENRQEFLPLRGTYTDMGPGTSHKKQVISLFLLGYTETEIAERVHHDLSRVETYVRDFIRVATMLDEDYQESAIIRLTRLSKKTVLSYVCLYKKYAQDHLYKEPLERVLELYKLNREFGKKRGSQ